MDLQTIVNQMGIEILAFIVCLFFGIRLIVTRDVKILKKDDPLLDPENEDLELEECDDREELEDLENEDRDDLEDDRDELDDLEERELELCLDGGILIHLFLGFAYRMSSVFIHF